MLIRTGRYHACPPVPERRSGRNCLHSHCQGSLFLWSGWRADLGGQTTGAPPDLPVRGTCDSRDAGEDRRAGAMTWGESGPHRGGAGRWQHSTTRWHSTTRLGWWAPATWAAGLPAGWSRPGTTCWPSTPTPPGSPPAAPRPRNDLAELAERCDVIMLSLPDSPVIESVIRNPGGLLEHARDGQVIVDLSTANPASTRALHARAPRTRRALPGRRDLRRCRGRGEGHADPDGRRRRNRAGPGTSAARHVQRARAPHGRQRRGPRDEGAQQLPQRRHAGRDGRGHGGGQEGRARPGPAAGGHQHLDRRQLRLPQPVPAHHQGRLPGGRADRAADGQGRPALPRPGRGPRRGHAHRSGHADRLRGVQRARLR